MFKMLSVLWGTIVWERWMLFILGAALLMHFGYIEVNFDPLFWAIMIVITQLVVRIIAKGVWLNGDVE